MSSGIPTRRAAALCPCWLARRFSCRAAARAGRKRSSFTPPRTRSSRSRFFGSLKPKPASRSAPVYDSEAVKTVGPGEPIIDRTKQSRNATCSGTTRNSAPGNWRRTRCSAQTNGWTHLGYRTRRLVINTNLLPAANAPRTFSDATNALWRGKVALAYPLFGTTCHAFPRLAPTLGRRGLAKMVPRAGGQPTFSGGWQFGRCQTGGARRGLVGFYRFGRHCRRATGGFPGRARCRQRRKRFSFRTRWA